MRRSLRTIAAAAVVAALSLTASCAGDPQDGGAPQTLSVAAVDNGDLDRLRDLSGSFVASHPGLSIEWVRQSENQIRETISTDVATEGGRFDVVTVGPFEAQIWGDRQLLTPVSSGMPAGFGPDQFIPAVRNALSYEGRLQAAPFYGESVFTMYRRDVLAQAGITMPEQPTWPFILDAAARVSQGGDVDGICLRGRAGWGENMSFVTAMAHSYGARWFDENWVPQLDSPQWARTVQDYLALAGHAPDDVAGNGFQQNLALFQQGRCAIWIDATSAASFVTDPARSSVADQVGFAMAPQSDDGTPMNWLWSWALAVPQNSDDAQLAREFVAWATSADYQRLVAQHYGPANVPPGARADMYTDASYTQAAPYAPLVQASIQRANVEQPAKEPVPYQGAQYVAVPAFQSIGNAVGEQLSQAIRGEISADEALANSQWVSDRVIAQTRLMADQETGN